MRLISGSTVLEYNTFRRGTSPDLRKPFWNIAGANGSFNTLFNREQKYTFRFHCSLHDPLRLLKTATSIGWSKCVAFGKRAIKIMPFSE